MSHVYESVRLNGSTSYHVKVVVNQNYQINKPLKSLLELENLVQ